MSNSKCACKQMIGDEYYCPIHGGEGSIDWTAFQLLELYKACGDGITWKPDKKQVAFESAYSAIRLRHHAPNNWHITPDILQDIERVAEIINMSPLDWEGDCYGIALALIEHGLIEGIARYGHWLGDVMPGTLFDGRPVIPHGWVELTNGWIVDPTRWSFEGTSPYIYIGENDYYDMGGNVWRLLNMKPAPQWNESEQQTVYKISPEAAKHVAILLDHTELSLSLGQRFWLLNLPLQLLEPFAQEIYQCAIRVGDGAIIPIDNKRYILESS